MTNTTTSTPPRDPEGQLRLALIELGRLEREIQTLTPRARDHADHELLRSLRACRAALLRMAQVRFAWEHSQIIASA
jgi:hypothetical protein